MKSRIEVLVCLSLAVLYLGTASFAQMPGMGGGSGTYVGYEGHNMDHDLILPQIAVGQHYTTSLLLLNLANSHVMNWVPAQELITTGKMYFYGQDGARLAVSVNGGPPTSEFSFSLDPSESSHYEFSSTGPDASGWVLIDIDEPASGSGWGMMDGQTMTRGMRVMADVFFTYSGADQPASRVGVIPSMYEMGKFATSIVSAQSNHDRYTGVAIANTSAKAVTVMLHLKDSQGNLLGTTPVMLNPGSQTARFIHELFPAVLPPDLRGFLEVSSNDEGIVTMGLLMSQGILTSVPVTHYGRITMMP